MNEARPPRSPLSRQRLLVILGVWLAGAVALAAWVVDLAGISGPAPEPTSDFAFPSAVRPSGPVEVWAVGDGAFPTRAARAVAGRIRRADPDRVLYLGDVYERGTTEEFRTNFASVYGPLVRRLAPTPGNHEWPRHRSGYDPYWRSVTGAATPPWYQFDLGSWSVFSLNSETPRDKRQLRWLRHRLDAARDRCVLAFWHRPRFSAGRHGDQSDVAPLWETVRGRAALVLNGHDHDLQRLRTVDGTTELVSGAGGRSLYPVDERDPRLAFSDDRHYGALRLRLRRDAASLAFVAADGTVLDRSSVSCRAA
jgi:hypothetical protein